MRLSGWSLFCSFAILCIGVYVACDETKKELKHIEKEKSAVVEPKVTTASITLGKQYEVHNQEYITWYVRDIYLIAPAPYDFAGFVLGGFIPSGKAEREKGDLSISALQTTVFINDSKPAPFRRTIIPEVPDEVSIASEYVNDWTHFDTSIPIKITVAVRFVCMPEIGKTEYHISLKDFWAFPPNAEPEPGPNGRGYKPFLPLADQKFNDFLVAHCPPKN